jgi:HAD superfamily hydrolase (TIGR01458 family)
MSGILFDLDGVLYLGGEPLPGAAEVIRWVQGEGVPHLYLTNTTSRPRAALVDKLAAMDMAIDAEQLLTPAVAALQWLGREAPGPPALFVPEATAVEFAACGPLPDEAESGAAAVVVGDLGAGWDFDRLNRAFRLLMQDPPPALVALGMTRYWRAEDGLRLNTGPFVQALSYASGRTPVVMGKPAAPFFQAAAEMLGLPPTELVMIGDDIRGDIEGAQNAGTGKFSPGDLELGVKPAAVLESVATLPDWWRSRTE